MFENCKDVKKKNEKERENKTRKDLLSNRLLQ